MKKDENHIKMRDEIEKLICKGFSIEEIALKLNLALGSRYIKKSAKWYKYCIVAKKNQERAIEK